MDQLMKTQLEERLFEEVQQLLDVGDQDYWQKLSHGALLEALENELRFLGLYAHTDRETPVLIHETLERHLDRWLDYYRESIMADEEQPVYETRIEIEPSLFIQLNTTASSVGKVPEILDCFNVGFSHHIESPQIDINSMTVAHRVTSI